VTVWPGEKVDETLSRKINAIFIVGPERTLEQDVEFAISQLVEIAVRALSPGINDPITAVTCIDWLGAILCQLANRKMPASHRYDEQNRLRVICKPFAFEGMVDAAFNMIRQNSHSVPAVSIHLLETIATVAAQTRNSDNRAVCCDRLPWLCTGARRSCHPMKTVKTLPTATKRPLTPWRATLRNQRGSIDGCLIDNFGPAGHRYRLPIAGLAAASTGDPLSAADRIGCGAGSGLAETGQAVR
jgi:hypothetical protein